jgi:hypothetical protein
LLGVFFCFLIKFIYFGLLKIFQLSPAEELVRQLQILVLPAISGPGFLIFLGSVEVGIGLLFLVKRITPVATITFALHMITTFLPFFLLPQLTWLAPGVPTLTGQYILKNIALVALVFTIFTTYHAREVPGSHSRVL